MKPLAELAINILLVMLIGGCATQATSKYEGREMTRDRIGFAEQAIPEGHAFVSFLYKIQTTNKPIMAELYFDGVKALSIVARRPVTLDMAPATFTVKIHSDLYSTASVNQLPVHSKPGEHVYIIYDSDDLTLSEVSKDEFVDTALAYPPAPSQGPTLNAWGEAALVPALPILLPAIVIFSVLTGQPVQQ